jgi:hypothetical protein
LRIRVEDLWFRIWGDWFKRLKEGQDLKFWVEVKGLGFRAHSLGIRV